MTKKTGLKVEHTEWNLAHLGAGDDDPRFAEKRRAIETASYRFINAWKDRDDYLKDPAVLEKALDEYEEWRHHHGSEGDEGYYFMLRHSQDQTSPGIKARMNQVDEFGKRIENDIQFFQLRIAKIPEAEQQRFLSFPGLQRYRHLLSRIFSEAKHLLSEPEEKIMNLKSTAAYANWVRMTSGFIAKEERAVPDEKGRKKHRSFAEIVSLMNSRKRPVRDAAARAFNGIIARHVDTAEAELNAILGNKKVDDELRGFPRPDAGRHLADDIESGVVDALVGAVAGRFDIPARYYALKAKLFRVRRLKYHERNVEYGKTDWRYPYQESVDLVHSVLEKLDGEFALIFRGFIEGGQIDAFSRKGKANGAFCAHVLKSQPTYILLNHNDKLHDVLTLAHELGHGINNELIRGKQHALYFGTPTSTAEVASTFMEDFVLEELIRRADDELRLSIMMMKLNDDVSSIFRQVACYRFEQELHQEFRKKGYLSKDEIGTIFKKHMSAYMGKAVEQSAGAENWWVYWSHIRYFFYVYSYASGLLISKSLQGAVKKDPAFIGKVKGFLSAGLSESPVNIFRGLGVDIADRAFWDKGLAEIGHLLDETEALARNMKKIR